MLLRDTALGLFVVIGLASCAAPTSPDHAARGESAATKGQEVGNAKPRLRTITRDQYLNTLAYLFGPDVRPEVDFPPVERVDGLLQLGNSSAGFNDSQLELYQKTAQYVSKQVVAPSRRNFIFDCKPSSEKAADKACASKILNRIGRIMFRQPLERERLNELVAHAAAGAEKLQDFYAGLAIAIEEVLISPNAMLVSERAEPDPRSASKMRLDSYSLAARLSYFLWNSGPDDILLKAAATGELNTDKGRQKVVDMMIASPRFKQGVRAFFSDMFDFESLSSLAKDPQVYPIFTGVTLEDSKEQTLRTVEELLINRKGDYRDLFTSRITFLSPALAMLFDLPAPSRWSMYEFPQGSPRAGYLTQVSFLAGHSHPGRSSPTLRGKALREILLCQPVPRPPANVDFSAVENPDPKLRTARDRLDLHRKNPVCAGCHKITDPMGLALENFDGSGRYRENEKGAKIDASGSLDGREFSDPIGLGKALHDNPSLTSCLVRRMYSYSTGSSTGNADAETLKFLGAQFAAHGYRIPDLARTIAMSSFFSEFKADDSSERARAAAAFSQNGQPTN